MKGKNSVLLREKSEVKHYLNEPTFNELLISRKKAMIDLREDHLSRSKRSEVRGGRGWRGDSLMKSQKKEKVEEIKKKHNNRLDQVVETEDHVQHLQA